MGESVRDGQPVERRRGQRRQVTTTPPAGGERRRGDRRQAAAATGAIMAASILASPALAADRSPAVTNPFANAKWFVDPNSKAAQQVKLWQESQPKDAEQIGKIASHAQADWFGDWSGDVQARVDARVTQITAAGALPVLVAYNIPDRDCSGGQSGGGAPDAAAYRDWIRRFSLGIAGRRAAVILEPDALADLGNCGAGTQQERLGLLWDAVDVLKADPAVSVYIDAGHSHWMPVDTAADRLAAAGVDRADGFSLNVSNFYPSGGEVVYGRAISDRIAGKHFVVDTSRNGAGVNPGTWCNPPNMALGSWPTAATGDARADAYLWVKKPGESDGACNGGPAAGTWWADYALGLAQRARAY